MQAEGHLLGDPQPNFRNQSRIQPHCLTFSSLHVSQPFYPLVSIFLTHSLVVSKLPFDPLVKVLLSQLMVSQILYYHGVCNLVFVLPIIWEADVAFLSGELNSHPHSASSFSSRLDSASTCWVLTLWVMTVGQKLWLTANAPKL